MSASARLRLARFALLALPLGAAVLAGCDTGEQQTTTNPDAPVAPREFRYESYTEVQSLFAELDYTSEAWMAGVRTVPRVYLQRIRSEWSQRTVKEIDVLTKKRLFFRAVGPLVLRVNEVILEDRNRLLALRDRPALEAADREWLGELAAYYGLESGQFDDDAALIDALSDRVDVVPVSLALAQSAEESGWGTSRFAFAGNALFGQWTWGEGIRPERQRSGKGDYRVAAFETPIDSVRAYARNLNTHNAYGDFRRVRAQLRADGKPVRGADLAGTLTGYSERGDAYVDTLRTIMRVNRLHEADDARLADMTPILLIPVGA